MTQDGHKVVVAANIGSDKDIDKALQFGCEGVGLFRSEFLFMSRKVLCRMKKEQFVKHTRQWSKNVGRKIMYNQNDGYWWR